MIRIAPLVVVLAVASGRAGARPTLGDVAPGPSHDIDDVALAQDLRAAFGAGVSHCTASECHTELGALWCSGADGGAACRAVDHVDHERSLVARGEPARRLGLHLRNLGSDVFDAGRVAAWRVTCWAEPSSAAAAGFAMHGHCAVELKRGDEELAGDLGLARGGLGQCKLGGFCWTGRFAVTCAERSSACVFRCAPEVEHDSDSPNYDWLAVCSGDGPRVPEVGDLLWTRSHARTATVECQSWRGEAWDGGLVGVVGCAVVPRSE